jgi:ATP-dependent DNA helicase RecG
MALPINIEELLNGRTVEWERIELKAGWNPKKVLHSICAFANDFNNWGGGYIFVGVEEENGKPILPPIGLSENDIDSIQKEILNFGKGKITPSYIPVVEPVDFLGKKILVIWVPMGIERPYLASKEVGGDSSKAMYIRRTSNTVLANKIEEQELRELSQRVPFVEQPNHRESLNSLSRQLMLDFLKDIGSALYAQAKEMSIEDLALRLKIVDGPKENLVPKNIGLLFFAEKPSDYFYKARIDLVEFLEEDEFTEKIFEGPLHLQIRHALSYIQGTIIKEKVIKIEGKAESVRFFNYPFEAIEEALVNAVYHKSYQVNEPIEVRITNNEVVIINYPGPLPPLSKESFSDDVIDVRRYRNGRVGDFLKEIHLTEARGTGVPKIKRVLNKNGSPAPIFDTDDDRSYFKVVLKIHPSFKVSTTPITEFELKILSYCVNQRKREDVLKQLGLVNDSKNFNRNIKPLIDNGWLVLTLPDKPKSKNQHYIISEIGKQFLK